MAQGGLFLDSRTVDTTTELSKRENIRQPLYLQAAIDPGPSSQISVDRISGLQMAARTYDTNGNVSFGSQVIQFSRSFSSPDHSILGHSVLRLFSSRVNQFSGRSVLRSFSS